MTVQHLRKNGMKSFDVSVFLWGEWMCKYLIELVCNKELLNYFCCKTAIVIVADFNVDLSG